VSEEDDDRAPVTWPVGAPVPLTPEHCASHGWGQERKDCAECRACTPHVAALHAESRAYDAGAPLW